MTSIESRVHLYYEDLSNAEKKVANYFLSNINNIFQMPIAKLAKEAGVSQVAWVRFSQSIGFAGLKDLKKRLYQQLHETQQETDDPASYSFTDIKDFDNLESIVKTIGKNSMQAIHDTMQLLDLGELERVASILINANRIVLFGIGASGMVADDFATKLMRIGKTVTFWRDTHVQITYATSVTEGDVCLFFSHSGGTVEILEALEIVKEKGVPTVSFTKASETPLSNGTDYHIYVSSPEVDMRSGATSSRLAHLLVVDILFTAIANKDYQNIEEKLKTSANALKHRRIDS